MRRTASFGFVAAACFALSGCPRSEVYPESVTVRAYSAPRDGASFLLVYEPYAGGSYEWKMVPPQNVELLAHLDGVTLTCTNTPCEPGSEAGELVLARPAPHVDHVEVLVLKEGYDPVRVRIAFQKGVEGRPTRIVFLDRSKAR